MRDVMQIGAMKGWTTGVISAGGVAQVVGDSTLSS